MSITAAILCGGQGTRLRPVIGDTPKCLAPVAGKPFLEYVLDRLASQGVRKVVLCVGCGKNLIQDWFMGPRGFRPDQELLFSKENEPLGTGGALRNALPLLDTDPILVLNGDTYCEFDLIKMLETYYRHQRHLVQTVYHEIGNGKQSSCKRAGVDLVSRYLLNSFPALKTPISFEDKIIPLWDNCNEYVFLEKPFLDIGTPEGYGKAEEFLRGRGVGCG